MKKLLIMALFLLSTASFAEQLIVHNTSQGGRHSFKAIKLDLTFSNSYNSLVIKGKQRSQRCSIRIYTKNSKKTDILFTLHDRFARIMARPGDYRLSCFSAKLNNNGESIFVDYMGKSGDTFSIVQL